MSGCFHHRVCGDCGSAHTCTVHPARSETPRPAMTREQAVAAMDDIWHNPEGIRQRRRRCGTLRSARANPEVRCGKPTTLATQSRRGVPGVARHPVVVQRRVRPFLLFHRSTVKPDDVAAEPRFPPRASGGCLRGWCRTRSGSMRTAPRTRTTSPSSPKIIAPRRVRRSVAVEVSAERSGRAIIASQVINGKRVQVERRRPFAVFIG